MLEKIIPWLCFSIVPYWFYRLFYNMYIQQGFYRIDQSPKYNSAKMRRYQFLYHIFMVIGLPLALLFYPVTRKSYRLLYARYVSAVTDTYHICTDPKLSYLEKRDKIDILHIPVGHNRDPIDLPDWWFDA